MPLRILERIESHMNKMIHSNWFFTAWNEMDMGRRDVSNLRMIGSDRFTFQFKDTIPFYIELICDNTEISILLTYSDTSNNPKRFKISAEEGNTPDKDIAQSVINDILDESEAYAFVLRIENIAIQRVRLQGGDPRDIPSHGVDIGKEYEIDYNELKKLISNINFDEKCERYMKMGQCWEYFYHNFKCGVKSNVPGPIRLKARALFETMLEKRQELEPFEIGRDQSKEYFRLQKECLTELQVPEAEFDERIQKYMKTYNYSDSQYLQFKRGIDAGKPA